MVILSCFTPALAGLYRGFYITLLRDVPAHAIYFTSYEACHELFAPGSRASGRQTALVQVFGGGLAGVLSWLGIYHFDVAKTRFQALPRAASPYAGAIRMLLCPASQRWASAIAGFLLTQLQASVDIVCVCRRL